MFFSDASNFNQLDLVSEKLLVWSQVPQALGGLSDGKMNWSMLQTSQKLTG